MADDEALRRDLLWRIEARRASIQSYLRAHRPRTRRRATVTVVLSSLAALFTAGPALGGETFAGSVQNSLGLASDSYVWRTLCFLTLLVSIGSAILVNLGKADDDVAKLSSAEAASTELEGLTGLLQYGRVTLDDGAKLYQQYIVKIPFVDDVPANAPPAPLPTPYAPTPYAPTPYAPPQQAPPPQAGRHSPPGG